MKIIDCTTYYSEDLMLDVRFNILNEHVDKFIIVESKFSHSGKPKQLNFDIDIGQKADLMLYSYAKFLCTIVTDFFEKKIKSFF